ncbi:MAG: cysteine desulfurase family protein [Gammaproteobacteria bacterium]
MTVYLDHNATTPLDPRVLEAMLPYLGSEFGNPSSVHAYGRAARAALETAREQVALLVNAQASQVVFTSGGTEANNLALLGGTAELPPARIAITAIEHDSVRAPAKRLVSRGWQLDIIAVNRRGQVDPEVFSAAIHADTRLVSIMLANNESGVVQDIAALTGRARSSGAIVHTDAVQAAGKIAIDFSACGAHLMSLSAHKLYGPKGVGALIVDKTREVQSVVSGGSQERGVRPGTENVAGIVGFGAAAEIAQAELQDSAIRQGALRDHLEAALRDVTGLVIFGSDAVRVPNTLQISVTGIEGETLLLQLDRAGFAVSSGSACAAGHNAPSPVLIAMGVLPEVARGALRISLGRSTTRQQVDEFARVFRDRVAQLRSGIERPALARL